MGGKGSGRIPDGVRNQQAMAVIRRVANGATLKNALAEEKNPMSRDTFRGIVLKNKELRDEWDMAKEMRAHSYFDDALDIIEQLKNGNWGKESNAMVRALDRAVTGLFYAAARLSPREYGERAEKVAIVPVHIHTSLNLGQKGPIENKPDSVYHLKASVRDAEFEPSGADSGNSGSPTLALPVEVHDGEIAKT